MSLEQLPHVLACGPEPRAGQLLCLEPAVAAVRGLAQHQARVAELLDPELSVVPEPAVDGFRVRLRAIGELAVPHRGGFDRIVRGRVEQECVAA